MSAILLIIAANDFVGTVCLDTALADERVKQVIWVPYTFPTFDNHLASCNAKLSIAHMPIGENWKSWPESLVNQLKNVSAAIWYGVLSCCMIVAVK